MCRRMSRCTCTPGVPAITALTTALPKPFRHPSRSSVCPDVRRTCDRRARRNRRALCPPCSGIHVVVQSAGLAGSGSRRRTDSIRSMSGARTSASTWRRKSSDSGHLPLPQQGGPGQGTQDVVGRLREAVVHTKEAHIALGAGSVWARARGSCHVTVGHTAEQAADALRTVAPESFVRMEPVLYVGERGRRRAVEALSAGSVLDREGLAGACKRRHVGSARER